MTKKKEFVGKRVAFLLMAAMLAGMVGGNGNELGKVHAWNCQYPDNQPPKQVYSNHYGGSDLRAKLQEIAKSESYFTKAEQSLMNATPVQTLDTRNNVIYTTTDKLYALSIWGKHWNRRI